MTAPLTLAQARELLRKVWIHARTAPICGACLQRADEPHRADCEMEALHPQVLALLALPSAPQEPPQEKCPHCKTGVNDPSCGGNDKCFHCGSCGYIGCMWTDEEKRKMLVASAPQTVSTEGLNSDERVELDRLLAGMLLPTFTDREREIARLAARAALSTAPAPAQGWQPITTAPKDGTAILIHLPSRDLVGEARWQGEGSDEGWWWAGTDPGDYHSSRIEEYEVAHWMPLPAPPEAERQEP